LGGFDLFSREKKELGSGGISICGRNPGVGKKLVRWKAAFGKKKKPVGERDRRDQTWKVELVGVSLNICGKGGLVGKKKKKNAGGETSFVKHPRKTAKGHL